MWYNNRLSLLTIRQKLWPIPFYKFVVTCRLFLTNEQTALNLVIKCSIPNLKAVTLDNISASLISVDCGKNVETFYLEN